ncbi:hypothetical protein [Shewanella maritima]|uniref:hypothetical protein n=1 Tax=Shewanella maritima TaxID=2520507 RepID=UPI003736BE27
MSTSSGLLLSLSTLIVSQSTIITPLELEHDQAQKLVASGQIKSLDYSLNWINQFCNGQLVDARLYQSLDKLHYNLQLRVNENQLIDIKLNAVNGMLESMTQLPSECTQNETVTR